MPVSFEVSVHAERMLDRRPLIVGANSTLESLHRARNDQTALGQKAPHLINDSYTLAHQDRTHPMRGDVLLLD